jgi:hypothetical protein
VNLPILKALPDDEDTPITKVATNDASRTRRRVQRRTGRQALAAAGRDVAVVTDDPRFELSRLRVCSSGHVLNIHLHARMGPSPSRTRHPRVDGPTSRGTHRRSLWIARLNAITGTRHRASSVEVRIEPR